LRRARAPSIIASTIAIAVAGCTFTGVGRYDIPSCIASKEPSTLADDPCNALNDSASDCEIFQCDALSGACKKGPRDFDRDGDPAPHCGGNDCDELDRRRTGSSAETCDGIDNDCSGIADDGLVHALTTKAIALGTFLDVSLSSANGLDPIATSIVPLPEGPGTGNVPIACILSVRENGESIDPPCTFLSRADALAPMQAWARPIVSSDLTFGTVFSDVGDPGCPGGRIGFRNTKRSGFVTSCAGSSSGASIPAFLPYPDGKSAVVAYLEAPAQSRADPVGGCSAAPPARLDLMWIERPAALDPPPRVYAERRALGTSHAMRTPALVPRADAVLLAAPADDTAGLWLLQAPRPDGSGQAVIPLLSPSSMSAFADARSISAALGTIAGVEHVAMVGEIGCPPAQRVLLTLVRLDEPGPVATVVRSVEVAGPAELATGPQIVWLAPRQEWWVSWIGGTPEARALSVRAVSAGGEGLGPIVSTARRVISASPRVQGSDTRVVDVSFVDKAGLGSASFGCP
jgi:hypothetical protein